VNEEKWFLESVNINVMFPDDLLVFSGALPFLLFYKFAKA
jgi:hypothetical protein